MLRIIFVLLLSVFAHGAAADIPKPETLEQTLTLMLERLQPDYPDAEIDWSTSNIVLGADGTVINPDNLHAVLRQIEDPAAREAELDRFLGVLVSSIALEPFGDGIPLTQVFPVVRHRSLITAEGGDLLYFEPAIGDLVRAYVIDYPDRVAYVTKDAMQEAAVSAEALTAAAATNLEGLLGQTEFRGGNGIFMALNGGFYESTLLLDDALWADLSGQLGDDLVIIVPNRDILVFAPASETGAVATLELIRADSLVNGPNPLSEHTYIWRDGRLSLYP